MVEALIELMLGDLRTFLLAQYNEYHLIINLIVIVYGVLLMWAHLNLRRVVRQMEAVIIDLARDSEFPLDTQLLFEAFCERWKESLMDGKLFLPTANDLWFSIIERANVVENLKLRREFLCVVLTKAGYLEAFGTLSRQTYRVWELYRHQLLIGMRARHLEPEAQLKMRGKQTNSSGSRREETVHGKSC